MSKHGGKGQNNSPSTDSFAGKVDSRREALEDLARSDLPCADIAEALLQIVEEGA